MKCRHTALLEGVGRLRRTASLAFCLGVLALSGAARADERFAPPNPLPLDWCLERARAENPQIAADEAAAAAARERVRPAGSFEDPRLGYEASNVPLDRWDFDSTPMSGHQLTLVQALPFPGLLSNRSAAAELGAEAAESMADDRRARVASAVERAWIELGFSQRAFEITDRNLALVRQLSRIAETKYSVGTGRQQDVLRAQVQVTRLLEERLTREAAIRRSEAALASLLDLPPEVAFPRTAEPETEPTPPPLETLLDSLDARSPMLVALEAQVEEASRRQRAAQIEGYPDVEVGLGYRVRESVPGDAVEGNDFVSALVRIRLPVDRGKWKARVAEQEAQLRRARANLRAARAQLREVVRSRYADLNRAGAEAELLREGLVPQSRQSLDSSRAGYEVDSVDFLSLIDSQVSLLNAELALVRAVADRRGALADLEAALGGSLQ